MLNLVKKCWNFVKGLYDAATTVREEGPRYGNKTNTVTVRHYDVGKMQREYQEFMEEQARIDAYFAEEERKAQRMSPETIAMWRENNERLNELLPKIRPARKPQLRVIKGNSVSA
jgi:hypothetical protein